MSLDLPTPRPEYETEDGHKYFKVGDIVRLRDPIVQPDLDRGVVVVLGDDWYVAWRIELMVSFDEISGDCLHVLTPEEKEREGY